MQVNPHIPLLYVLFENQYISCWVEVPEGFPGKASLGNRVSSGLRSCCASNASKFTIGTTIRRPAKLPVAYFSIRA